MILLAAMLAMQELPPVDAPDIVVIAQRLQRVQVNVALDKNRRLHCSLSASSGSPKLDEKLCRESAKCVRKVGYEPAAIRQCVETKKPKMLAEFRKEWARSRKK